MASMDRATVKAIGEEMAAAAAIIAAKYGMTITRGGGKFDAAEFTPKVTFVLPAAKAAKAEQTAVIYAPMLGLSADVVGKTFKHKTKTFTVTGLNPSRPKNAVELSDENGKAFKCSVPALQSMMR